MTKSFAVASLWMFLALTTSAQAVLEKIQAELKAAPVALRGFPEGSKIRYDAQGNLLRVHGGIWTIHGLITVNDTALKEKEFRIHGTRMAAIYDDKLKDMQVRSYEDSVELRIPYEDDAQLGQALRRVFVLAPERLSQVVPEPWRKFLEQKDQPPPKVEVEVPPGPLKPGVRACKPPDETGVYRVCAGISSPEPTSRREPGFSEFARRFHFQGHVAVSAVVGVNGRLRDIEIIKPAGAGFDEQTLAALSTWTFNPAKKDGTAVPVRIAIDIDFHTF